MGVVARKDRSGGWTLATNWAVGGDRHPVVAGQAADCRTNLDCFVLVGLPVLVVRTIAVCGLGIRKAGAVERLAV